MKISTWNLMRPTRQTISRNHIFHDTIKSVSPDILILTETNSVINPGKEYFSISTKDLHNVPGDIKYSEGENRVTIYSKFPFGKHFKTYNEYSSVCSEILTDQGSLIVYGTIVGVYGGRGEVFREDFDRQKDDIAKLAGGRGICIAGDFNISFSGYPYPSHSVIKEAKDFFERNSIKILTKENLSCPDHVAISKSFLKNLSAESSQIPFQKKITDHSLITVSIL